MLSVVPGVRNPDANWDWGNVSLGISVRRVGALITSATVLAATLIAVPIAASAAEGGAAAAAAALPATVSADALPTVQIDNGVIWSSEIVGDIAYVGGEFANARPAGAAPGTNLMARGNILAFNIKTGVATSFAPMLNGRVNDITASPDGTKLFVVGTFTQVNNQTRNRIAVFNLPSGTLSTTVVPDINGVTQSVAATNDTVYVGGYFSAVNNSSRARVAAVRTTNGSLLPWRPIVDDGMVQGLVVSPDNTAVVMSGNFVSVAGGLNNPGYGLARVNATTGAQLPLPVNSEVRDAGPNSGITNLKSDGTNFYGVGWHYGSGGNSEGTFSANWTDGSLKWIEDCHGDTYDVAPVGDVVYTASHKHYCGNSGGFPQTSPTWSFYHSTAFTKSVEGVNTGDIYGYPDHPGKPRPALLNWFPQTDVGTYTGKSQAVWTVDGAGDYVIYGGEFPKVNGTVQQGLVRYAVRTAAPNKQGPRYLLGQSSWAPSVLSVSAGTVRVSYQTVWDRDDLDLTYRIYRDNENAAGLVDQQVVSTPFWEPKQVKIKQTGLTPGATSRYRVTATDPYGNVLRSDWVTVTVSNATPSPYVDGVINDGATNYWRLGEASGTASFDWAGDSDLTVSGGLTRGAAGAIGGDPDKATNFSGGFGATNTSITAPGSFAVEAWINTTTTSGGKIIGFGNSKTGDSGGYDRHVYMDNSGKIWFGVYPNAVRTLNSTASYNDGQWHHIVASMGSDGMKLYIDGKIVGQRADTTTGQPYAGYWRVGGDNLGSWPDQPSSNYFSGKVDDVAIYAAPLTQEKIRAHYTASGRTVDVPAAPADAYGAMIYNAQPELYWRYDEASGSSLADAAQGVAGGLSGSYQRGQTGALANGVGNAVKLDSGNAYSSTSYSSPSIYSMETWFKTTSNQGGKVIGFGDNQTGTSGNYDRHVYMQDDGKLVFGVWTGQANTISTSQAFNNGTWHHVVATQGPSGMTLYVDGVLQGTNAQTAAQTYTGYWRVGGDNTWGSSSAFLNGTYDETAVYNRVLSSDEVASHYAVGSSTPLPNQAPTAAFTVGATNLAVSVDASASTDSDGQITSYLWNWGDGTPAGTGKTASHDYTSQGTYTVTLTVKDDDNEMSSITHDVLADAPNVLPTATFAASVNGLQVAVDAAGSSDSDGAVASYDWDFGDGTTGTGLTSSRTYTTGGPKTITLKVTDNEGGFTTTSQQVTAIAPNQAPVAAFTSSSNGLTVSVNGSTSSDPDGTVAGYSWNFGDGATASGATASHPYGAAGSYTVTLTVTDNSGATNTKTGQVTVSNTPPPPSGVLAVDNFDRAVSNGWGSAEQGGAWTLRGTASRFSVASGAGAISVPSASTQYADLNGVSSTSSRVDAVFSVDKLIEANYVAVVGRRVGNSNYIARLRLQADGGLKLYLLQDDAASIAPALQVPMTVVPGEKYVLSIEVTGTAPTTVKAKVWKQTDPEPAWQRQGTNNAPALQAPGAVSVFSYLPNTTLAPLIVSFDKITVRDPSIP